MKKTVKIFIIIILFIILVILGFYSYNKYNDIKNKKLENELNPIKKVIKKNYPYDDIKFIKKVDDTYYFELNVYDHTLVYSYNNGNISLVQDSSMSVKVK